MNITLRKVYVDAVDWAPEPVEIDAGTAEELEERLFDYLASEEGRNERQSCRPRTPTPARAMPRGN